MPVFLDWRSFFVGGEAFLAGILNRRKGKAKEEETPIATGQVYVIPQSEQKISVDTWKTTDLLRELTTTRDKFDAIDLIIDKTPDGKMAYNTYLRIANQGIKVEFFNAGTNRPLKKYDAEWRAFCANMGGNTSNGLDGLVDQLHGSEITHGGMACEVVVAPGANEIQNVIIIDPKTIKEFEWLPNENRYAAYQQGTGGKKVDLYEGNFFWIPHQPKPGHPDGTLQFEPAITTMTEYYQLIRDSLVVLNRIGFPKFDIEIAMEQLLANATPEQLADEKKRKKLIEDTFEVIKRQMNGIDRDSNLIHYDSVKVGVVGGGINGSGIDVRAWFEMLEPLVVNSFQLTPVLLGRLKSGSYSLGTAEYKIVKDTMEVLRRNSKRMIENIANLWARVNGYNVYAVVTHNPIEWQVEKEKYEAELLKMERARRAEEYRWLDHDAAAIIGVENDADAQEPREDLYEYIGNQFVEGAAEQQAQTENNSKESADNEI